MNNTSEERKVGNWRIKKRFLFFPLTIGPDTRWLQFVKIKQVLNVKTTTLYSLNGEPYNISKLKWMNEEFINE